MCAPCEIALRLRLNSGLLHFPSVTLIISPTLVIASDLLDKQYVKSLYFYLFIFFFGGGGGGVKGSVDRSAGGPWTGSQCFRVTHRVM